MEQGGRGGEMNKQPQKEMQQGDAPVQVQATQQPQKCPRCDSLNTKFCYYNNYSLSQPRYFCKTCRRYWTQGGTLRNVPVGGGCRKGKRAKSSNSSSPTENSSSRSLPPPPPPQPQQQQEMVVHTQPPPLTTVVRPKDPSIGSFYQSGGYLSSLAAMHSLNPSSHPFDQSLNVAGTCDALRSSNLGLLSGFNVSSLGPQLRPIGPIRPPHLYQMGSGDATRNFVITDGQKFQNEREVLSMYGQGLVNPIPPSSMANTNSSGVVSQHDWSQSFINDNAGNRASDASLWSTISTTIGGNSDRTSGSGSAGAGSSTLVVPNQWPNLPGYGPPP